MKDGLAKADWKMGKNKMRNWKIIEALPAHIPPIAAAMRAADRREVRASSGCGPEEALRVSLGYSPLAWTCFVGGTPAFMWGVGARDSALGLTGAPWLLATEEIRLVERDFARQSRLYVESMQALFPRLENYTHAENVRSLRWLRWCGFEIARVPEPHGVSGEPFYRFWREKYV